MEKLLHLDPVNRRVAIWEAPVGDNRFGEDIRVILGEKITHINLPLGLALITAMDSERIIAMGALEVMTGSTPVFFLPFGVLAYRDSQGRLRSPLQLLKNHNLKFRFMDPMDELIIKIFEL